MCDDRLIRRIAGGFVMASVALGWLVSPMWYLFTAFVGLNLLQSSFTAWCPLERMLGRFDLLGCTPRLPDSRTPQ